jgi:hypothetical protein
MGQLGGFRLYNSVCMLTLLSVVTVLSLCRNALPCVVVHTCNPSTMKAEVGGS